MASSDSTNPRIVLMLGNDECGPPKLNMGPLEFRNEMSPPRGTGLLRLLLRLLLLLVAVVILV